MTRTYPVHRLYISHPAIQIDAHSLCERNG